MSKRRIVMNRIERMKAQQMKASKGSKAIASFLIAFFFSIPSFAQQNIKSEEVDVVKAYQPLLADAVKIPLHAEPAPVDTAMQPLKYDVKQHVVSLPFTPSEIKPLALPQQEQAQLQNNLIKAGAGTQLTPLFEVYLGNGRSDKYSYGANFHYLSSHATGMDYQDVSHLGGNVSGTSYFKSTALSGGIGYDQDVYHFYGFDPAFTDTANQFSKDLLKNQFQNFSLNLGLGNTKPTKSEVDYDFQFRFHDLRRKPGSGMLDDLKEDYFRFDARLGKTIQKVHHANLDLGFERENFSSSMDTAIDYFSILPNYEYRKAKLFLKAGVNLEIVDGGFMVNPVAEGSYEVIGDYLIPYAGIFGGSSPNTLKEVSDVNPFIAYYAPATSEVLEGYGGVKGSYGNNISYNARLSYGKQTNVPFYHTIGENPSLFTTYYYYEAMVLRFRMEVGYKQSERLNLLVSGETSSWDLDYDDEPIGIPKSKLSFSANYNIQNKIIFTGDLFLQSGAFAFNETDSVTTQMKGRIDVNLGATYNYKKNIGFWVSLNNITASKQREWYNYPTYGLVAMGGVLLKF